MVGSVPATGSTVAAQGEQRRQEGRLMTDFALGHSSPAEVAARLQAERSGMAHLVLRDAGDVQVIVPLDPDRRRVTVGRGEGSDVQLHWDRDASRAHAELEPVGGVWTISDDGLSRNGTFVNGERVGSRQRLRDGDVLRIGHTVVIFRDPGSAGFSSTHVGGAALVPPHVSVAQRRVLLGLYRPYKEPGPFTTPATNQEIAAELFLSVEAVKTHLRALFAKFGVEDLPQNQKRAKLIERAFQTGVISERDL
jgi:pSer/pThr/pTyr-binding forkhead associated (FHA) protein